MTKSWLLGTATLFALCSASAWATDAQTPPPPPPHGSEGMENHKGEDWVPYEQLTLEKAREHAHKKAEKLDKMTPEEWEAHKKERMDRRAKWKNMSREDREKMKAEWKAKRGEMKPGEAGTPPAPKDDKSITK